MDLGMQLPFGGLGHGGPANPFGGSLSAMGSAYGLSGGGFGMAVPPAPGIHETKVQLKDGGKCVREQNTVFWLRRRETSDAAQKAVYHTL